MLEPTSYVLITALLIAAHRVKEDNAETDKDDWLTARVKDYSGNFR